MENIPELDDDDSMPIILFKLLQPSLTMAEMPEKMTKPRLSPSCIGDDKKAVNAFGGVLPRDNSHATNWRIFAHSLD